MQDPSCALRARSSREGYLSSCPSGATSGVVRKLPSGRWQASDWHEGDRHVARETFAAKTDALIFLSSKETDILRGEWVDPSAGKITFAEFASLWLANQSHLRPRTLELYRYLLGSHITPTFGQRQLSAIRTARWSPGTGHWPQSSRAPHQRRTA